MRKLVTVAVFLGIMIFCIPAHAQSSTVLVYNTSARYWYAGGSGTSWSTYNGRSRGLVVLDVSMDPNGAIDGINSGTKISTSRSGGSKYYSESSIDFDVTNVVDPNSNTNEWILTDSDTEDNLLTILQGDFRSQNIGNADANEVAPRLEGNEMQFLQNGSTTIATYQWSYRLNQGWTRQANQESYSYGQALAMIRERYRDRGYDGVPDEE